MGISGPVCVYAQADGSPTSMPDEAIQNDSPDEEEIEYQQNLRRARLDSVISVESAVLELAQKAAVKLNKQIELGHETTAFTIAIVLAIFKDGALDIGLDLLGGFGEIPILGQLPGLFVSAALFYFLWGKGWCNTTKVKAIIWILGIFIDNLPLANELPMTVLTVFMAWHVVHKKAGEAEEKLQTLNEKTMEELEIIEQEE